MQDEARRQQISALLGRLTERQRTVIELRYHVAYTHAQALSQSEVSRLLGVSRETIACTERQALRRMATAPGDVRKRYGADAELCEEGQCHSLAEAYQRMCSEQANITVHTLAKRAHTSDPLASAFLRTLPEWGSDEERLERAYQRLIAAGAREVFVQDLTREAKVRGQVAARYLEEHVYGPVQERLQAAFQRMCSEEGRITLKRLVQLAHCREQSARAFLTKRGFVLTRGKRAAQQRALAESALTAREDSPASTADRSQIEALDGSSLHDSRGEGRKEQVSRC